MIQSKLPFGDDKTHCRQNVCWKYK